MNTEKIIHNFTELGFRLQSMDVNQKESLFKEIYYANPWFTPPLVEYCLNAICLNFLNREHLTKWLSDYTEIDYNKPILVGIIMAGNIPLSGFHDLLCVLASGNCAIIKTATIDKILTEFIVNQLIEINPMLKDRLILSDKMNNCKAIITSGTDNTARYFDYYFKDIPRIIRKNRNSIAILNGFENEDTMQLLADDVFLYFGLGCRNVTLLMIPENFAFEKITKAFLKYKDIFHHHKYYNNYIYYKTIYSMNKINALDFGFFLLKQDNKLSATVSNLHYMYYKNEKDIYNYIEENRDKIQCIVSDNSWVKGSIDIGKTQQPRLWDYSDGIDTMKFLEKIEK